MNNLSKLLVLRSENDIELDVKEVQKKGSRIEIGNSGYNLAGFDHFKSEILSELKRVIYRGLDYMVYRLPLAYDEIVDNLDVKYIAASTKRYTLAPGVCEVSDIIMMLKSLLPKNVKVKITIDDIRLNSNLTINKSVKFTKKSFF